MLSGVSPEALALLRSSDTIRIFDLYTFALIDGTLLRYTSADVNLTVDGVLYQSTILFERTDITVKSGLEVDEMVVTVYADD